MEHQLLNQCALEDKLIISKFSATHVRFKIFLLSVARSKQFERKKKLMDRSRAVNEHPLMSHDYYRIQ